MIGLIPKKINNFPRSHFGLRIEVNFSRRRPTSLGSKQGFEFKTNQRPLSRSDVRQRVPMPILVKLREKNQQKCSFTLLSRNRGLLCIPSSYEIEFGRNDELGSATNTTRLKDVHNFKASLLTCENRVSRE